MQNKEEPGSVQSIFIRLIFVMKNARNINRLGSPGCGPDFKRRTSYSNMHVVCIITPSHNTSQPKHTAGPEIASPHQSLLRQTACKIALNERYRPISIHMRARCRLSYRQHTTFLHMQKKNILTTGRFWT